MSKTIPARDQVDPKYTWNAESVFASTKDWDDEVQKINHDIEIVLAFKGRLKENPATLSAALEANDKLMRRAAVA